MNKNNSRKENKSMYLYTALIFAVALLLIIVAFFAQTNVSRLGNRANEFSAATPSAIQSPDPKSDELAKLANMAAELDSENKILKSKIEIYENLILANSLVSNGDFAAAEEMTVGINEAELDDDCRVLFEEIKNKINERKDQ